MDTYSIALLIQHFELQECLRKSLLRQKMILSRTQTILQSAHRVGDLVFNEITQEEGTIVRIEFDLENQGPCAVSYVVALLNYEPGKEALWHKRDINRQKLSHNGPDPGHYRPQRFAGVARPPLPGRAAAFEQPRLSAA